MSYRELWVFIQHLPQESWTQTVCGTSVGGADQPGAAAGAGRAEKFGPWALINYQIADLTTR
jgi:hypothetical protein